MTTVNVRIELLGSSDRLYVQNGTWGRQAKGHG